MSLSSDLVSKFAKIAKPSVERKKESTVYGTIRESGGAQYVQFDGSDLLTPITTTTSVKNGERVVVMIKNHTAMVTGNVTSPSANQGDVKVVADSVEVVLEDVAKAEQAAENAVKTADEASKTATDYMSFDPTNGLQIGSKSGNSWVGFRTQIGNSVFNILDSAGVIVASYGAKLIELGKNATDAVIKFCGGKGQIEYDSNDIYFQMSSDTVRLKGTEMASVYSRSGTSFGAVHTAPSEVQIVAGTDKRNSNIYVKEQYISMIADVISVDGTIIDNDTGGEYISTVKDGSGIWTFNKWSNGDVELWGSYWVVDKACNASLGSWYRTDVFTVDEFPFTVHDANLVASYESAGYGGVLWPTTMTTTSGPPSYYLIRPTSGTIASGVIRFHVRGRWK